MARLALLLLAALACDANPRPEADSAFPSLPWEDPDAEPPSSLGPLVVDGEDATQPRVLLVVDDHGRGLERSILDEFVPSFVVYDDGTVIVYGEENDAPVPIEGRIPEPDALRRNIFDLLLPEPDAQSTHPDVMDLPLAIFLVRSDAGWIRREVEGVRPGCVPPYPIPAVDRACQYLQALTLEDRRAWQPSQLKLTLVEVDRPLAASQKPWPTTLPPLPAGSTRFDYLIPATHLDTLKPFVDSLGPKGVVLHLGRTWAVSYRRVVPQSAYLDDVNAETRRRFVAESEARRRARRRG